MTNWLKAKEDDKMACVNLDPHEEEKMLNNDPLAPEMNPDFLVIRIVGRIVLSVIKQCWALAGAMFISICVFYWVFGGISAFILLCFSAAGNYSYFEIFELFTNLFISILKESFITPGISCYTTRQFPQIPGYLYRLRIYTAFRLRTFISNHWIPQNCMPISYCNLSPTCAKLFSSFTEMREISVTDCPTPKVSSNTCRPMCFW